MLLIFHPVVRCLYPLISLEILARNYEFLLADNARHSRYISFLLSLKGCSFFLLARVLGKFHAVKTNREAYLDLGFPKETWKNCR